MRRTVLATTAATLLALSACGTDDSNGDSDAAAEPETFTVAGTILLAGYDGGWSLISSRETAAAPCKGEDGFSDINRGTAVSVLNSSGEKIAIGELNSGTTTEALMRMSETDGCLFTFAVDDVPVDGDIYSVEISHRGGMDFTIEESENIALSLG